MVTAFRGHINMFARLLAFVRESATGGVGGFGGFGGLAELADYNVLSFSELQANRQFRQLRQGDLQK